LSELAANFGYEYVKSRCKIYKKSGIFARGKDVWRIYIYDINGEKNGVTDIFDIKNLARRLRKFARRRRKISKIYARNHRK